MLFYHGFIINQHRNLAENTVLRISSWNLSSSAFALSIIFYSSLSDYVFDTDKSPISIQNNYFVIIIQIYICTHHRKWTLLLGSISQSKHENPSSLLQYCKLDSSLQRERERDRTSNEWPFTQPFVNLSIMNFIAKIKGYSM